MIPKSNKIDNSASQSSSSVSSFQAVFVPSKAQVIHFLKTQISGTFYRVYGN